MSQRHNYRTPDGIIHLWTQEEMNAHVQMMHVSVIDATHFEDDPISTQEEATLTVKMLYDLLYRRATPAHPLDHETVQDLLSRIDVMAEPLKEMVQALEVKR